MEIILLERVEKLGQIGDIVTVKAGFARNYLLPQKKALRATDANKKYFEAQRKQLEDRNKSQIAEAEKVAARARDVKIVLLRQAGESGQLYGSVTARDIAKAIREKGVKEVRRGNVVLDAPIKDLGLATVHIRLHADVVFDVKVNIARSAEEAEAQVIEAEKLFESEELAKAAEEALADKPAEEEAAEGEAEVEAEAGGEEETEKAEKAETKEDKPQKKAAKKKATKKEAKAEEAPAKKAAPKKKAPKKKAKAEGKAEKKPAKKAAAKKAPSKKK